MIAWLLLLADPAAAWRHLGAAWDAGTDFPIAYQTDDDGAADCLDGMAGGVCAAEARAAWDQWTGVGCSAVAAADLGYWPAPTGGYDLSDGVNGIAFGDGAEPGVLGFTVIDASGIAFARDGVVYARMAETDIVIAPDVAFLTHSEISGGACTDAYDLGAVLAHEIGHALGLGHSCEADEPCADPLLQQATMFYAGASCDDGQFVPNEDDVAGLQALYGPSVSFSCGTTGDPVLLAAAPATLNCAASTTASTDALTWTFGDGETDTGATVTHTWEDEGLYTVTVTGTGADQACGDWTHKAERVGYVRVCAEPRVAFHLDHVLGATYDVRNDTEIDVVGCIDDVTWTLYAGDRPSGQADAVFENWEFTYEFPSEGTWTLVLDVHGPGGYGAAEATFDVRRHSGLPVFGCDTGGGAGAGWALLALLAIRRRR